MATLSNPVFYKAGTAGASAVVGLDSSQNRVVRYDLKLESGEQASHISVLFDEYNGSITIGNGADQFSKINGDMSFYFAISTDPHAFANAGYADISRATGKAVFTLYRGSVANADAKYRVSCEADMLLYPGKQYYLWVFPGFSNAAGGNSTWGWVHWGSSLTTIVELSGHAEIAWVKTSEGFKASVPYVRQNGSWKHAIPYMRKNNAWHIGTGQ